MTVGLPRDTAEWAALLVAILAVVTSVNRRKGLSSWGSPFVFRVVCASAAALISGLYVVWYLRGGPRIVDATTYFLEGRALAEGRFGWDVGDAPASTMGRFLVRDTLGSGAHASGIFPPGYPAMLALGFLVHAPLAVGPALAFILVLLTFDLAREAALCVPALSERDREVVPRVAALLSVVCAALRYHTADTMSHGLAAVLLTGALSCAFRLRNAERVGPGPSAASGIVSSLLLGMCLGWLTATRPVSGAAGCVLVALVLGRRLASSKLWLATLMGATPFLALLVLQQHAATGAWLTSSQSLYYAVSDGPSGCFAFGFGPRVGCRIEHGDFVRHNLPNGYGAYAALATTLRRLKMHLGDPLDAAPLSAIVVFSIARAIRTPRLRPLALSLPVFAIAYAPFYFDGNYPGGGARFFADQLPVEHVLVALFIPVVAARMARFSPLSRFGRTETLGGLCVALAIAGFAFFAGKEHALLRDREGGRPMFEPSELDRAGVHRGIVFVDTDHGFALGFDPGASPDREVEVARFRGDATDRFVWEAQGKPQAYRYVYAFDPSAPRRVSITPFEPPAASRLEAEALWPPLSQEGGYAVPSFHPCASAGRWLELEPEPFAQQAEVRLALPRQLAGKRIRPRIAASGGADIELRLEADGALVRAWSGSDRIESSADLRCAIDVFDLGPALVPGNARSIHLIFGARVARALPSETAGPAPGGAEGSRAALDALVIEENR